MKHQLSDQYILRKNCFERHPAITLVTVTIVLFLLIDFSAALILQKLDLFTPAYQTTKQRDSLYRSSHTVYHHTLLPNVDYDNAEWGGATYTVRTNSLGFKDGQVREVSLQSDKPRILITGDSFTEGVGIEYKDTFVGHIHEHFKSKGVDILNAGVTSYSPIIHLLKTRYYLEAVGLNFDHLVVFIDLSDMEDEALGYKLDPDANITLVKGESVGAARQMIAEPPSLKSFLNQHTVFIAQLRNLAAYLRSVFRRTEKAFDQRRGMWTLDDALYKEFGEQGQTIAAEHMSQLKALLDERSIGLTIAVYPWPDQIVRRDINSRQVTFWQAWGEENGVNVINLFPDFINDEDPERVVKTNYIRGDVHWNKAGHKLVAERFLYYFDSKQEQK